MKIYGRVQGVFFRSSARERMAELGLQGWVRNCDDECVETEVEGEEEAVGEYRAWCKKGPRGAKVERVEENSPNSSNSPNFQ